MAEINNNGSMNSYSSISDKKEYYKRLRDYCATLKDNQFCFGQGLIKRIYPLIRNYKIELEGVENIPKDTNVLFVANHSNSHDIFTAYEMFSMLERMGSVMVATDCLSPVTREIFNISNATLLDRNIKEERENSVYSLSKKIIDGNDGLIFGESTWNIHPTLPMHNIRNGAAKISLISEVPIVPVIFEYIENDGIITSESNLIKKCVIRFGHPVMVDYNNVLSSQSNNVKDYMTNMRKNIWNDYNIKRNSLEDIDSTLYINHTYVKKFKALGFQYDSRKEQEFLLFINGEPHENEYTFDSEGRLVPGITEKGFEYKKIK